MADRIVWVRGNEMEALRKWLEKPNGSYSVQNSRLAFEAVEDGGVLVRIREWREGDVA